MFFGFIPCIAGHGIFDLFGDGNNRNHQYYVNTEMKYQKGIVPSS